ncbi:alpha-amylase family glycosyl hydrolase, partial [Enterococcus faecalis]|uniref:alpha-amylase family glycosyl hydrolase n=1 Tax=Enterococcus faecalis TaxID=1351 RepID=UPI001AD7C27F
VGSEMCIRDRLMPYNMMIARGDSKEYALAALRQKSRDNCRIPMQWTDEKYYGFSTNKPWLMGPTHDEVNVERALEDKNSVFYTYQKLIKFRKEMPIFVKGDFELIDAENNQVFAYKRVFDDETVLVVSNFTSETIRFDTGINLTEGSQILVANYPRKIVTQELELQPFEAMMILKNK